VRILQYRITKAHENKTIGTYLKQEKGYSSALCTLLKQDERCILRNDLPAWQNTLLKEGDRLTVTIPAACSLVENGSLSVTIVYEDEDVILFDKPHGMPVHPSHGHYEDTLGNFYAAYLHQKGEDGVFSPITRLDRDTSGFCLVAKHPLAAAGFGAEIQKEYLALLSGVLPENYGIIDAPIAREADSVIKRCVRADGKESKTEYRVLKRFDDRTLVRVRLHTGRTHQIRVHFAHLGYPLAGDDLYGGDCSRDDHQRLCCVGLTFRHPVTGQIFSFQKPPSQFEIR